MSRRKSFRMKAVPAGLKPCAAVLKDYIHFSFHFNKVFMRRPFLALTLAFVAFSVPAGAALPHAGHAAMHQHVAPVSKKLAKNPAVKEYVASMKKMHAGMNITYTGDADIDFVRGMVPHHQGAVDMGATLKRHGKDAELRKLGEWIEQMQKLEIAMMNRWLEVRDNPNLAPAKGDEPAVVAYKAAMEKMHQAMHVAYTGDADVDFARGMIPHHEGAIDMAWVLKEHGRDPQLRRFADDIIRSQSQEVAFMKTWLAAREKPAKY